MQTVPSLVGTGTAIAAAAGGLVFGQPIKQIHKSDHHEIPSAARAKARGHKRTISIDQVLSTHASRISILPSRRPATSSAATASVARELDAVAGSPRQTSRPPSRRQRLQNLQTSPPTTSSRNPPLAGDCWNSLPADAIKVESRNSLPSTNSWFRRLSLRPLSQHGTSESSILADSTSCTISHGSTAPILSQSISALKPLSPNKLVKRAISKHKQAEDGLNRKSKGHLPSLRRPATSHQRSATLQQFRAGIDVVGFTPHPKYSFDEPISPEELLGASPIEDVDQSSHHTRRATSKPGWTSFFHIKTREFDTRTKSRGRLGSAGDAAAAAACRSKGVISKRIHIDSRSSSSRSTGAYLVKPRMVSIPSTVSGSLVSCHPDKGAAGGKGRRAKTGMDSPPRFEEAAEVAPATRSRRSFSCSFAHTEAWPSKVTAPASSLRSNGASPTRDEDGSDQQRHMSAQAIDANVPFAVGPLQDGPTSITTMHMHSSTTQAPRFIHHSHIDQALLPLDSAAAALPRPHEAGRSNASSPPAPLSYLDLPGRHADSSSRLTGPATGGAFSSLRSSQLSGSSTSSASGIVSQRRDSHHERFHTVDGDARDLHSGDDDDTDVKSDAFDSVRTAGSGRARAVETPVESVYDDSPPSTGGVKKSKRSSIQEILDYTWNENGRIMEEDETGATPVRAAHTKQPRRELKVDHRLELDSSPSPRGTRQMSFDVDRFSLNDDGFDEDWTRDDDEAMFNTLLSTSKGHSCNPSRAASIHSNVQLALASIEGNSVPIYSPPGLARPERTLGNLFDWSEPPAHDKLHPGGGAPRPQTAYGKQLGDSRGGRSAVRKGPVPTHVRSQSVPIVHESIEDTKLTGPKYSTWGLGTKTVSEDWDEDFEFAGDNNGPGGRDNHDLFAVPESIRASQPSVRAHSGQIREFSLLVNDLKRLCRHGRELNMLNGDEKSLWKEAEGIIALASPDEDHAVGDEDDESGSCRYVDASEPSGETPREERGFDVPIEILDSVLERDEPAMSKTAVVRERQSPRRRSVFSPDDDIFGSSWPLTDDQSLGSHRPSRPRTPENKSLKPHDVSVVVRSVVETMQKRSLLSTGDSGSLRGSEKSYNAANRMHFDTNSLKALVRRAGEVRDMLADIIRRADQLTQTPVHTPRHERDVNSSPAFTRVFDDPGPSPSSARRIARTRENSIALVDYSTPDKSSPSNMGRRIPLMTVN